MQKQYEKENNFITLMIKMVGTSCNMCCEYCYEHISDSNQKNFSTTAEVIDFLSNYLEYKSVLILFHGGEPLIAGYEKMKECLRYIKESFKYNYFIQFQTNGTLLTSKWIELFKEYLPRLSLSVSLDPIGEKDLRLGKSFDYRKRVLKNIKLYHNEIDNFGIISVVHRFNINSFVDFIEDLIEMGVKSLTVNKYYCGSKETEAYISEKEYVDFLKRIAMVWISKKWYQNLNIQPLNALFSKNKNKLCIYLADEKKCSYFKTFYGKNNISEYCDHVTGKMMPKMMNICEKCNIYSLCGGGCFQEEKDETFCIARRELFDFIEGVKNGNKKTYNE